MLNDSGDVVIKNNEIQMISDDALLQQRVQSILGTNKGEWPLNSNEGINFKNVLGKHKQIDNNTTNVKQYYESEIQYLKAKSVEENSYVELLEKRLEGDI